MEPGLSALEVKLMDPVWSGRNFQDGYKENKLAGSYSGLLWTQNLDIDHWSF